jgi:hypothetical protein
MNVSNKLEGKRKKEGTYREENVQGACEREGEDDTPAAHDVKAPLDRDERCREDDAPDPESEGDEEGDPETLEDTRDLDKEVRTLDLLLGGAPLNVVAEQVGEEGLRQVNRETTEEEEAEVESQHMKEQRQRR